MKRILVQTCPSVSEESAQADTEATAAFVAAVRNAHPWRRNLYAIYEQECQKLRAYIADSDSNTIVLSHPDFGKLSIHALKRLEEALDGFDVVITADVAKARPQD